MFLLSLLRVRGRIMSDSRWSASVVLSTPNEYCSTKMVNAEEHGMFNQNLKNIGQPNKRINSLPLVAGTTLRAHFASLKSCTRKLARYAECYVKS